jgi:hypothetical protein
MKSVSCICENVFDAEVPESMDLDASPEAAASILDGSFLNFTCPACGKLLKPEFRMRVTAPSRKLDLEFLPEEDRAAFYAGKLSIPAGRECVIGFPELLDRVRVVMAGLDHRAVEVMKYVYLSKAEEQNPHADIQVYFHGLEGDSLVFHILGVAEGQVAVIKADRSMYESVQRDLPARSGRPPFSAILSPPYVSVRKLDMED